MSDHMESEVELHRHSFHQKAILFATLLMLTAILANSSSLTFATLSSSLVCIFLACVATNLLFKSRGGLAMYFFFFSVPPSELFYDQK